DGQPRLQDQRGDSRAVARVGRRLRADDRHGHPRSPRSVDRRQNPVPRRRADRAGVDRRKLCPCARGDEHAGVGAESMIRVALRGLLARKVRAALTALAIVLGVAMVSGTYILTDTIKSAFSTVFARAYKKTDVVITATSAIGGEENSGLAIAPSLPAALLAQVRALPGVAQAAGSISDHAQLVGHNGKVIARGGAPALALSYDPQG